MAEHETALFEETDGRLLNRVQQGEVEAYAPLVRRYLPGLRAFVAMRLPVQHLADVITHETFVLAFRRIREFDSQRPFRPWLQAIAWNLVRAELQRFAREQTSLSRLEQVQHAEWSSGTTSEMPADEALLLEECLNKLPAEMRQLLDDSYQQGASAAEIAQKLGRTRQWVRVTLFRVRKQLRDCIESKLGGSSYAS
jgi:RNA polymerase sigma-70 factor (ECF subfamily)